MAIIIRRIILRENKNKNKSNARTSRSSSSRKRNGNKGREGRNMSRGGNAFIKRDLSGGSARARARSFLFLLMLLPPQKSRPANKFGNRERWSCSSKLTILLDDLIHFKLSLPVCKQELELVIRQNHTRLLLYCLIDFLRPFSAPCLEQGQLRCNHGQEKTTFALQLRLEVLEHPFQKE